MVIAKVAQTDFKFKGEISFFHMGHRYWITFTTITFKENLVKTYPTFVSTLHT